MISLVTGANRGIGHEVCRQLTTLGHTVLVTARSDAAAAAPEIGPNAHPMRLDITSADDITRVAETIADRYGHLDVLVNNAAIHYDTWQRAITADLAVVHEAAETNVYGPWRLTQALLPLLRRSEHPRIVNVSSE